MQYLILFIHKEDKRINSTIINEMNVLSLLEALNFFIKEFDCYERVIGITEITN